MAEVPVDLAAWLTAQFDEDESLARRNSDGHGLADGFPDYRTYDDADTRAADEYVERFGPARVLAEIAAKRKRLAMHRPIDSDVEPGETVCAHCTPTDDHYMGVPWPCDDVLLDAAPYAGRPGWRDEWKAA